MGVLESVLEYKKQREAEANADINAIPTAVNTFIAAKQAAQKSMLDQLQIQMTGAAHGLRVDPQTGTIIRDESLISPLEQLITKGKAVDAAKSMGDRNLFNSLVGSQTTLPETPTLSQPNVLNDVSDIQAPEIDLFTGKPTTRGLQQEAKNKLIEASGSEEIKTQAKNKEKLKGMEAIEGDLDSLLVLYKSIPSHDTGPIEGRTRGVFAKIFGTDTALTTFEDSSGLVLANISREFGGEKGVLTDKDIDRIKAAFPNKTDTPDIAKAKVDFIKDFVRRKIEVKKSNGSSPNKIGRFTIEVQ